MSIEEQRIARRFASAMRSAAGGGTHPGDDRATVTRVEDGKAWVQVEGGREYPADLTINASPGDTVQVRRSGGRAWLVGNATVPPTGDAVAKLARKVADLAGKKAVAAQGAADAAQETADAAGDAASEVGGRLDGVVSVDCVYSATDTAYTFTGYVFRGGVDVTEELLSADSSKFTWTRKTEDGETQIASGTRSITVEKSTLGYGGTIVFSYDEAQDSSLLSTAGEQLESTDGSALVASSSSASIRLDELPEGTVTDAAAVMLWGTSTYRASVGDLSDHVLSHNQPLTNIEIEQMLTD